MWPFGDILTEKQKLNFHQTVQFRKKQTTPQKTIFAGYKGYGMFWEYYRKILHENAINNRCFITLSYTGTCAKKKLNFNNYQILVGNQYRSILFDFI